MVDAAKKTQVSRLSTTEHISQFTFARQSVKFGSVHESGRMFSSFDDYLREFDKVKGFDGVQVRKGLEVDFIGKYPVGDREGGFSEKMGCVAMFCARTARRD